MIEVSAFQCFILTSSKSSSSTGVVFFSIVLSLSSVISLIVGPDVDIFNCSNTGMKSTFHLSNNMCRIDLVALEYSLWW